MRRLACACVVLGLAVLAPLKLVRAQEPAAETSTENKDHKPKEPSEVWKWANFILLAGGIGYLIRKNAPPFFAARSQKISQDMIASQKLRAEAEARAADVDRRLANLDIDIAALRAESQAEIASETERLGKHTAAEIAKVQAHAKQEIESAGKAARMELKRYAAELAINLAESKIRARMTPETQDSLVSGFVHDLENPPSDARRN